MVTNKAGGELRPTGAPPHVHNFDKLERVISLQEELLQHQRALSEDLVRQSTELVDKMHEYLEQRAVDNGHITAERLQNELKTAAEGIRESVLAGVGELIAEKLRELRDSLGQGAA